MPGIRLSVSSTTLTDAPSALYTQAISSPMMPPPTTSSRSGIGSSSSAPVESTMRGSSGKPGNHRGLGTGGDDALVEADGLAVVQHKVAR